MQTLKLCILNKLHLNKALTAVREMEKYFCGNRFRRGLGFHGNRSWSISLQEAPQPACARTPESSGIGCGTRYALIVQKGMFMNGRWCFRDLDAQVLTCERERCRQGSTLAVSQTLVEHGSGWLVG